MTTVEKTDKANDEMEMDGDTKGSLPSECGDMAILEGFPHMEC